MTIRAVRDALPTVTVDSVTSGEQWSKITVDYTVSGMIIEERDYAVVFEVTADGQTASVTNSPTKLTTGAATKVIDTETLFGRQVLDENAKIKVSLTKVVGCQQLWRGGPYWAECNVGAKCSGDCGDLYDFYSAKVSVSAPWRVPSDAEIDALLLNCGRVWEICTDITGKKVVGCRFTGGSGCGSNSIFLPAAGYVDDTFGKRMSDGTDGRYWASTLWMGGALFFNQAEARVASHWPTEDSMPVRAIRDTPLLEQVDTDEEEFCLGGLNPLEYVDANGRPQSRPVGGYELLTEHTATIGGGRWYAVTGTVSRGTITVNGSANVILCDGAKLTVSGTGPGVRVDHGNALTIYGQTRGTGELTATGGANCAGIGGGNSASCGEVTINGGEVATTGGISGGWTPHSFSDYAGGAGIGGGHWGSGGSVTINGGTVTATGAAGGAGIGAGSHAEGGSVTINGGNIVASSLGTAPKNDVGESLYKVTLIAPNVDSPVFDRLDDYGLQGVFPVNGKFCFYLPDGNYEASFGTATDLYGYYFFIVNGKDVVCNLQQLGLTVNGVDVTAQSGSGWIYSDRILRLGNSEVPYVLSVSTYGDVQVQVASDCTVDLSDAIIYTQGRPAFVVDEGVTATLRMKGGASHLAATNAVDGTSVSAIEVNGTLNVEFAPGADSVQSEVYAFNFGDKPAIGGSGEVSIIGGHLCAWSDERAVADTCGFGIASESSDKMIAQAGMSWTDMWFVSGRNPDAPIIEVAPSCRVRLPIEIPGVKSCVVANAMEPIGPSETVNMTNVNRVMVLDDGRGHPGYGCRSLDGR